MNYSKYPLVTLIASISVSMAALSGCSAKDADSATLAELAAQADSSDTYNVDASRNNGAWGAVYMTKEALTEPPIDIVSYAEIPVMAKDPEVQKWQAIFNTENSYSTYDGAKLYHESCAACHMHEGQGAQGAGYYPPLADNTKMESKYYIISILINGLRGMPAFHAMMDNEQMAAVTQYVRSELNNYKDPVTAAHVAKLRHDYPPGADPSE